MRHRRRMRDQGFDPAEAFGERVQTHAVQDPPSGVERPQLEGEHAAEPAHLAHRQRVLRM
jgi:hypothetical protein